MRKQIQQEKNTLNRPAYQMFLPMDVGVLIKADESVRLLLEITERLDYNVL